MSIQQVYDHWNSKSHRKWRGHGKLTTKMTSAITDRLSNWTVEDLFGMIDNFYLCKTDKRFTICNNDKWPKWTLSEFFTRGVLKEDLRCEWFQTEEFDEERWYTDKYKRLQIERRKKQQESEQVVKDYVKEYGRFIKRKSQEELEQFWLWKSPAFKEAVKIVRTG